jgi:hypothetical protein
MITGQNKSPAAIVAFVVFAGAAVLHIVFDRRNIEPSDAGIGLEGGGD